MSASCCTLAGDDKSRSTGPGRAARARGGALPSPCMRATLRSQPRMRSTPLRRALALDARLAHAGRAARRARAGQSPVLRRRPRVPRLLPGRHRRDVRPASPAPVARAIAGQASRGLTAMLPSTLTAEVGQRLALLSPAALADHAQRQRREPLRAALGARDHRPAQGAGVRRLLPRHGGRHPGRHGRAAAHPHARQPARPGARSRARHGGRSLQRHRRGGARAGTRRRGLRADRAGADELRPGAAAAGFSRATAARLARTARSWCSTRRTPSAAAGAGMRASRNSSPTSW